jgi:hypothetical protein
MKQLLKSQRSLHHTYSHIHTPLPLKNRFKLRLFWPCSPGLHVTTSKILGCYETNAVVLVSGGVQKGRGELFDVSRQRGGRRHGEAPHHAPRSRDSMFVYSELHIYIKAFAGSATIIQLHEIWKAGAEHPGNLFSPVADVVSCLSCTVPR